MVISKSACTILDSVLDKKKEKKQSMGREFEAQAWGPELQSPPLMYQTLPCTLLTLLLGVGNRQTPRVHWPGANQSSGFKLCRSPAVLTSLCYCYSPDFPKGRAGFISLYMLQSTFEASQGHTSSPTWRRAWLLFGTVLPLTKELTHSQGSTAETMEEHSFLASTWTQT